jgi:hypothetical protein
MKIFAVSRDLSLSKELALSLPKGRLRGISNPPLSPFFKGGNV